MKPLRGLYVITSEALCRSQAQLLEGVEAALLGGAALVQYRDKWNPLETRELLAAALLRRCHDHGVPLIINDDAALAARIGADGVHLGRQDLSLNQARPLLPAQSLIGVTCGSDVERAQQAVTEGIAYAAFGRFYPSRTKPLAPPAAPDVLARARQALPSQVAVCAIGGITPENARPLLEQGADLIAVVDGVFGAADIREAAARYAALFKSQAPGFPVK